MVPEETPNEQTAPAGTDAGGSGSEGVTQPSPEAPSGPTVLPTEPAPAPEEKSEAAAPAAGPSPAVNPTTPAEPPKAGLPSVAESKPTAPAGSPTKPVLDELKDLGNEGLDKAKEIGRKTLKAAIEESRDYIMVLLKDEQLSQTDKLEIQRLYIAAEKHALMGKMAVAHSMSKRIENYIKSHKLVVKSEKARATQNYLSNLLKMATGAVSTFLGAFGKPLVDKLSDIGLKAVDEFVQ